ncbi:MAG: hypothetical protein VYD45_11145 [Pseudomonadota bacterium]|nr:hypothetical protein [Pseudomonadota bacterium]
MKLYSVKYKAGQKSPGSQKFWRITVDSKYKGDIGLLTHEVRHVLHWWVFVVLTLALAGALSLLVAPAYGLVALVAPWTYHWSYRVKALRIIFELDCYRAQLRAGSYVSDEFAVKAMVGHGMSASAARDALE